MIPLLIAISTLAPPPNSARIGAYYTDAIAGLAVYRDAVRSAVFDVGWLDDSGKERLGYRDLVSSNLRFGDASPDDAYHIVSWRAEGKIVTFEWGLAGTAMAVGRVSSTGPVTIMLHLGKAWTGSDPIVSSFEDGASANAGGLRVDLRVRGNLLVRRVEKKLGGKGSSDEWIAQCRVAPHDSIVFGIGDGKSPNPAIAAGVLDGAKKQYEATRLWAEGDWGNFVAPIQNQLGNSRVYSIETGRLAHTVSRGWCLPDGQVLFCWDSFFNGLLASLEDPAAGRATVEAVLAATTRDGFVANFSGRGWGRSDDRSQPPVGSMCVWKMNEREPNLQFLRDVYPKLLRWHRWWFAPRSPGGAPNRDGNRDGLLEWGTRTGILQNAKFESGLDDSPMFDDATMAGPNMTSDSTDLSALWAMDADYLARIADAIGKRQDAIELRRDRDAMNRRIESVLWNAAVGTYCYRYWSPRTAVVHIDPTTVFEAEGKPGFRGEYFAGTDFAGNPIARHDKAIDFSWTGSPIKGLGKDDFSVRWTAEFRPRKTASYVLKLTADDGVRAWVDGKQVVDGWKVQGSTSYLSKPIAVEAGTRHDVEVEYYQAQGGAEAHLEVQEIDDRSKPQTFSSRLSPLSFYPLITGNPPAARADAALNLFFDPRKFDGQTICPSISRDDPAYPAQGYWRGTVWGPTSYLTFLGIRRFASDARQNEYAGKSVRLFMKNWKADGTCHENFNAITGWGRSDPHYTWGALLCLLGLEELCDVEPDGRIRLNGDAGVSVKVHNLRLLGRLFDLEVTPRKAVLREGRSGRVVARAVGRILSVALPARG